MYGTVVLYKPEKGFGFIRQSDKPADTFFHFSEFAGDPTSLKVGAVGEFNLGERKGKTVAREIRLLEPGATNERN